MTGATFPTLQTKRLELRGPVPADAQRFMDFYKTERSHMAGGPLPEGLAWRAFAADFGHWAIHGFGRFMITLREDNRPIGLVGPYAPLGWPEKEIGWVLFEKASEGKGYATEAARACVDYAWHTLGWETIVSYIAPENDASIALAERLGATLDPEATPPKPDVPCHVFRHPRPEGLA